MIRPGIHDRRVIRGAGILGLHLGVRAASCPVTVARIAEELPESGLFCDGLGRPDLIPPAFVRLFFSSRKINVSCSVEAESGTGTLSGEVEAGVVAYTGGDPAPVGVAMTTISELLTWRLTPELNGPHYGRNYRVGVLRGGVNTKFFTSVAFFAPGRLKYYPADDQWAALDFFLNVTTDGDGEGFGDGCMCAAGSFVIPDFYHAEQTISLGGGMSAKFISINGSNITLSIEVLEHFE